MRNTAQKVSRFAANKLASRKPSRFAGLGCFQRIHPGLQQMFAKAVACLQDRCDSEPVKADDALNLLKRRALSRLAYVGKRLYESPIPPRSARIALASLMCATLLTGVMRGLLEADSSLFLLGAVVVSAVTGGLRAGLLTTLFALFPCAWFLLNPTQGALSLGSALSSVILFGLMALVTCALSDSLYVARQQAEAARQQAENMARRSRFLAQASALLDNAPDYAVLLGQVTRASVPAFADWATVDMLDANNVLERVAATHLDLEKEKVLCSLRKRFPVDLQEDHPLANALRTGQGELIADVTASILQAFAHQENPEDSLAVSRLLAPRSLLFVPMQARGRVLGVLTFASASAERRYTATDMAVARDLATRAALAVDNLRLYREARREIEERVRMEQQIREVNAHLQTQRWELEEANTRLAMQVNMDGLTGLNNHRAFQEALQKELGRTRRYGAPLSLLLLDVDHFKQYNDTYGHPAGDRVLRQVAEAVQHNARATDFVARYGGEEFVVILPDTDEAGALQMAERLRQAVEAMTGLDRAVTASFGAATLTSEVTSPSELISRADKALYASKHTGRNRVTHARTLPDIAQAVAVVRETLPAPDRVDRDTSVSPMTY